MLTQLGIGDAILQVIEHDVVVLIPLFDHLLAYLLLHVAEERHYSLDSILCLLNLVEQIQTGFFLLLLVLDSPGCCSRWGA